MKRFISIALVAILLAISLPLGAFAVEDETPAIVSQPTLADPTFVVSPDDGATYQWYVADVDMVTDSDAVPVTKDYLVELYGEVPDNIKFLKEESTFNQENGKWSPAYYGASESTDDMSAEADAVADEFVEYFLVPFYVTVGSGAQYIVIIDGVEASNLEVLEVNYSEGAIVSNVMDNTYAVSFEAAGTYMFMITTETAPVDPYVTVVEGFGSGEAIESETSATLSCDIEPNAYYFCVVTYPDETELVSDFVSKSYYVKKQPDAADPSVQVTFSDEVKSYQWYTFEPGTDVPVTDKNASVNSMADYLDALGGETPPAGFFTTVKKYSSYDSENDLWTPSLDIVNASSSIQAILLYFTIELEEGDEIIVDLGESVPKQLVFGHLATMTEAPSTENSDGTFTFTAETAGEYLLLGMGIEADPSLYTLSAYGDADKPVAIEGETEAELSDMSVGEKYFCEITYEDGFVISSNVFRAEYVITHQPTGMAPTVGVTFPEDVKSYEWYKVTASDYGSVTPFMVGSYTLENSNEIFELPSDIEIDNDATSYDPETEIWTPVNYNYKDGDYDYAEFFVISMEAGESLVVELVNGFEDTFRKELYLYSIANMESVHDVENEDGTYTITVDEAGEYLLCYDAYSDDIPEGFGAKIYKNNVFDGQIIEGQAEKTLAEKVVDETYMCVITYEDGTILKTDMFTVLESDMWLFGDVDKDGDVDKEDYIAVKRSCFGTRILTVEEQLRADVTNDGEVTKEDYLLIKRSCFGTYVIE